MKLKKTLKAVSRNLLWLACFAIPSYLVTYFFSKWSLLVSEGASVSFPLELRYQLYPQMELVNHLVSASVSVLVAVVGLYFVNRLNKNLL